MNTSFAPRGIKGFFMSLLPSFEKKHLEEGIDVAFKELETVSEMYQLEGSQFAKVVGAEFPNLESQLRALVPAYRGDIFRLVRETISARKGDEGAFRDFADKLYGKTILRDNLDYSKVYTLRYVDGLLFFSEYARKLAIATISRKITDTDIVSPVDRVDRDFLNDVSNIRTFCMMLDILQVSFKELQKDLSRLKNVQFNAETHDAVMANEASLSGVRVNFLPVIGHIALFLGKARNSYISHRLEESKLEQEKLQVKLLLLRRQEEQSGTPEEIEKLQKQIKYYNNRLNKVNAKIEDILEDA